MEDEYVEQNILTKKSHVPVVQQLAILGAIMLLIFGTGYIPKLLNSFQESSDSPDPTTHVAALSSETTPPQDEIDHFANISILADAAYVWDVRDQRALYQKSPDTQLPLASITKLMTALVAHEILEDGVSVSVSDDAIRQDGSSGLSGGESFTLRNLLNLTLMSSSNDGAYAIAAAGGALLDEGEGTAATFVEAMNIRASELGLTQTYFRNPTGLDLSETESGAYGSARDVTFLMEHILTHYPEILEATTKPSLTLRNEAGATHNTENTNPTVSRIPGIIGSKTGYTDLAGGNLAIAFDAAFNRPIIVVVLGSSITGRFEDVLSLTDAARKTVIQ